MKVSYLKSAFVAALAMAFSSCDKSADDLATVSENNTTSISNVVYPLLGNEMSTSILPKKLLLPDATLVLGEFTKKGQVKVIDLVCEEYLEQTKKLDFSHVQEGKFREQIVNDDFSVYFRNQIDLRGDGFKKLSSGPKGWWTHWNYHPFTESEYPTVLFAVDKDNRTLSEFNLILNKQVTIFGFEVAPNTIGQDVNVRVTYHLEDHYRSLTLAQVLQTVSSPSGARLIAIKSEVPFERVTISVGSGAAITNIRYKLR